MEIIFALSSIFDYITGAIGELIVFIFDLISSTLIETCTLGDSFQETYNKLLFDTSKGLFKVSGGATDIFGDTDPTVILQAAGLGLAFGLMVYQLFKSLFGQLLQAEAPSRIIWRGLLYSFLISTYNIWTNLFLKLIFSPLYKTFAEQESGNVFAQIWEQRSAAGAGAGFSSLMADIAAPSLFISTALLKGVILLILMFPIGIKLIQLSLEIMERFLQIFFIILFGPLCLACGVSITLETPAKKWVSIYFNSMIALILNVMGIKLSLLAFTNWVSYFSGVYSNLGEIIISYIAVYALFKISCEFDQIQRQLGFDTIQAGGLGLALFGGLSKGAGVVAGVGRGGFHSNMFSRNGAMANAAARGSGAAQAAMALGNRGVLGAAIGGAAALSSKESRGALSAAAAAKGFGTNSHSNFGSFAAAACDNKNRGSINGKDLGSVQKMLSNGGIKGECTSAYFDGKGQMVCNMADGSQISMAPNENYGKDNKDSTKSHAVFQANDGSTWGAIVPSSQMDDMSGNTATIDKPAAEAIENAAAATPEAMTAGMHESHALANNPDAPLEGASATAAYDPTFADDNGKNKSGYVDLATDGNGNLVPCDKNGNENINGEYYKTAAGGAVAAAALESTVDSNGNKTPQTFKNVGSQLMYNTTSGDIGLMGRDGQTPSDFQSYCTDDSGHIRTASQGVSINVADRMHQPIEQKTIAARPNEIPTSITGTNGSEISLGTQSYSSPTIATSARGQATSVSNHQITVAQSSSGAPLIVPNSINTSEGTCQVQAQKYSDATGMTPSSNGSYVRVGSEVRPISDCQNFMSSAGTFTVPVASAGVALYSPNQSTGQLEPVPVGAIPANAYVKNNDGNFEQISPTSYRTSVTPSQQGTVECFSQNSSGSYDITPSPAAINDDGSCKMYELSSSGSYIESIRGTHILGEDGKYYEAQDITAVANANVQAHYVGEFRTNSEGEITITSDTGAATASDYGGTSIKTDQGQTIEVIHSQNTENEPNSMAVTGANGYQSAFIVSDTGASYAFSNTAVAANNISHALFNAGYETKSGNLPEVTSLRIQDQNASCIYAQLSGNKNDKNEDVSFAFLSKDYFEPKNGILPENTYSTQLLNGKEYFAVPRSKISAFSSVMSVSQAIKNAHNNVARD